MVVSALVGMGALLLAAAVLSAGSALRLHSAYREALRELRDGDRRLEPGAGPGRRLEDELRWYADVTAAGRDSGWRYAAAVVVGACVGVVVLAVWTFTVRPPALSVATAVVLLALMLVIAGLCLVEGRRFERLLHAAGRRSALGSVRRLEDALVQVRRANADLAAANRIWLRTRSATYPFAPQLARWRHRAVARATAHRSRALAALTRAVPVDLAGIAVRPPEGYADGVRGLTPLALAGPVDDDTWASAVADLNRAAERDGPRRTRWLSAVAACAELRDDPPARESAARWALDAAALPPRTPGDVRSDPLPDTVAIQPTRPETWEGAVRRARAVGAGPLLLAEATLRWAYALAAAGHSLDPAVTAAAEVMTETGDPDEYLRRVRPGFEAVGATSAQLSRLVPQWHAPTPAPTA
ncbi:MAG TPA: hypothetical protein VH573_07675 [Mycobacteriales bacterium]